MVRDGLGSSEHWVTVSRWTGSRATQLSRPRPDGILPLDGAILIYLQRFLAAKNGIWLAGIVEVEPPNQSLYS